MHKEQDQHEDIRRVISVSWFNFSILRKKFKNPYYLCVYMLSNHWNSVDLAFKDSILPRADWMLRGLTDWILQRIWCTNILSAIKEKLFEMKNKNICRIQSVHLSWLLIFLGSIRNLLRDHLNHRVRWAMVIFFQD